VIILIVFRQSADVWQVHQEIGFPRSKDEAILTIKREEPRMTNLAVRNKLYNGEECQYYSWLEDYLERLEGKDAYREFQERSYDDPEYYALVASLAA
jgi:hypothetical protein